MMRNRRTAVLLLAAAVALGTAGCSGNQPTSSAATPAAKAPSGGAGLPSDGAKAPAAPPSAPPATTVLLTVGNVTLGDGSKAPVLVDSAGSAVYVLTEDSTAKPHCSSLDCISFWPAVLSGADTPVLGDGVTAKVTIYSHDGLKQLAINDHPLYSFGGDNDKTKAGGNGLTSKFGGGNWAAVSPDGTLLPAHS